MFSSSGNRVCVYLYELSYLKGKIFPDFPDLSMRKACVISSVPLIEGFQISYLINITGERVLNTAYKSSVSDTHMNKSHLFNKDFFQFFIGVFALQCVLVSTVLQNESAICIYIYLLFLKFPSHLGTKLSPLGIWGEFPVLYGRFSLVIYFLHSVSGVYKSIPIS